MSPLKRLFSYTLRFKFSFAISIVGFLMFAAADIAAVEWIRRIIAFINSSETDFSIYLVLALIFIALGRGVGFFIGNYFMSRVGFGIVHDLRSELFSKLINLPKLYFDQNMKNERLFNTIIHELFHVICYNDNIDVNQRGEEPIAKAVGDGYTRIFKQNPNLWNILHDCIF